MTAVATRLARGYYQGNRERLREDLEKENRASQVPRPLRDGVWLTALGLFPEAIEGRADAAFVTAYRNILALAVSAYDSGRLAAYAEKDSSP